MKRDYELFSSLWEKYHSELYRYIYCHLNNRFDSEDILQTAALKAAKNFYQLKNIDKAKTWFFTIATNTLRDYYRKKKVDVCVEDASCSFTDTGDESYIDLKLSLNERLKKLPVQKQNLIDLYIQDSFTLKEIAKILNIGYSTARKWMDEIKDCLYEDLLQ